MIFDFLRRLDRLPHRYGRSDYTPPAADPPEGVDDEVDDGQDGEDLLYEALAAADDALTDAMAHVYRNPRSAFARFRRLAHQMDAHVIIWMVLTDPGTLGILLPGIIRYEPDPGGPFRRTYRNGEGRFDWTPEEVIFTRKAQMECALVAWFSAREAVWGDTFEYY
jgi:hypothetical protein